MTGTTLPTVGCLPRDLKPGDRIIIRTRVLDIRDSRPSMVKRGQWALFTNDGVDLVGPDDLILKVLQ